MKFVGKGAMLSAAVGAAAIAALASGCAHAYRLPQCTATPVQPTPAAQPVALKGHNSCKGHVSASTANSSSSTATGSSTSAQ